MIKDEHMNILVQRYDIVNHVIIDNDHNTNIKSTLKNIYSMTKKW